MALFVLGQVQRVQRYRALAWRGTFRHDRVLPTGTGVRVSSRKCPTGRNIRRPIKAAPQRRCRIAGFRLRGRGLSPDPELSSRLYHWHAGTRVPPTLKSPMEPAVAAQETRCESLKPSVAKPLLIRYLAIWNTVREQGTLVLGKV